MTAKEYLREMMKMDAEVAALREQIHLLEQEAEGVKGMSYTGMPKGGKVRDTAEVLAEIADLQTMYTAQIDKLTDRRKVAMAAIAGIERTELRSVLIMRYCLGRSWKEIARELNYSKSSILRLHGDALQAFGECWDLLRP